MHDVSLAFLWHQHQPYYPDDLGRENPMPWVRLHGTKDYWGMAMHLKEVPELRATINLVPSLLVQLRAYTEQGRGDAHLRISRLAADSLSHEDMLYLLDNFFLVPPDQMIRPYPRYRELYEKRGARHEPAERVARRFSRQDVLDLQVWSNLVWIHPIAFERDADLEAFRRRGRGWSEDEKQWLLDRQMAILAEVIPLHRELAERGQIELTTTPFYHPILPLLADKRLARRAMPDVPLPRYLDGCLQDVAWHVKRAVALHESLFGHKPRGMWPSEGSVAQAIIGPIADAGLEWIATDEEILSASTDGWISRDAAGYLRNPQMLYRPWRIEEDGRQLQIVFRDHAMSDQIGFHYQRYAPQHAVDDFVGKLEAIGHATRASAPHRPTLVSIVLDGENCWEYYPQSGLEFLRQLYRRIAAHPRITPVRVADYLERYPATDRLGHVFPGSWISHNFAIWIGHPECNRAWDLLHETRRHLIEATTGQAGRKNSSGHAHDSNAHGSNGHDSNGHGRGTNGHGHPPQVIERAWEELAIAQGSDWFWWFGDDHHSSQDHLFDRLFRLHLQNVYTLLGHTPPLELLRPISRGHGATRHYSEPTGLLQVKVDGRHTYFEWIDAGLVRADRGRGTMTQAGDGHLESVRYGFDSHRLLLRLDPRGAALRERLAGIELVRVTFLEPAGYEVLLSQPTARHPLGQMYAHDVAVPDSGLEAAAETILELGIPLRGLGVAQDEPLSFYIELVRHEAAVERMPREGAVETTVPSADFEQIMWQV